MKRMDLSGAQTLAIASQLAFVLAACVMIGIFAGSFLDARWGTSPLMILVGSILGTAAGIYSFWRTTKFLLEYFERKNANKSRPEM